MVGDARTDRPTLTTRPRSPSNRGSMVFDSECVGVHVRVWVCGRWAGMYLVFAIFQYLVHFIMFSACTYLSTGSVKLI